MSNELSKIVRDLTALRKQVHGLSTTSQINHSSLDNSTIVAYDADGHERLRIGRQDDGTHAIKHVQGPPPPQPSAPTVTVDGVVITVEHDGTNVGDAPLPADYRRRIVYAGFAPDMSDAVPVATIEPPAGGQAVFMSPGDGTVYVAVKNETFSAALSVQSQAVPVEVTMVSLEGELAIIKDSANGKNKNYYSPTAPESGSEGDVWFDTSIDPETGQPKWGLNLWDGSEWVSARDSRLQVVETAQAEMAKKLDAVVVSADGGNKNFYSTSAPTKDVKVGDLWFDGSKSNVPHRWDGKAWVSVADERVAAVQKAQEDLKGDLSTVKATADGKNQSYYQPTKPTGTLVKGDLWFDTSPSGGNRPNLWDGSKWVSVADLRVAHLLAMQDNLGRDLAGVRESVDGKTSTRWEASVPTSATPGSVVGDTWHQYKGGAHVGTWRWDGRNWVRQSFDPVMIPRVDIGTGTFGELDGARIKADTIVADKVLVKGSVGSTVIANGAITTDKIATGAITAESGVVGSLDAGKITSGYLDSARIQAGSIRADQVQVSTDDNWLSIPMLANGITTPHRSLYGGEIKTVIRDDSYGPSFMVKRGNNDNSAALRAPEGSSGSIQSGTMFPVQAGMRLTFQARLYRSGSYTDSVTPKARTIAHFYKPGGSHLSANTFDGWVAAGGFSGATGAAYQHEWVVPQGAVWMQLYIQLDSDAGWVVFGDPVLKPMVSGTLIEPGAITTEKIATGAITAESGVIGSLDLGKATVGELDGARIKAGTVTVDQLLSGSPSNVLPGVDNLSVSAPGWSGFGLNKTDPSLWLKGRTTVMSDAVFELSAGATYTATTDVKSTVNDTQWLWQLMGQDGQPSPYIFTYETAGTGWRTVTSQFTVKQSGRYKLRVWANHTRGASNTDGYQWWRNPRISPAVDATLIKDGSVTTSKIAANAITAESGVIGSLDAGKITVGELDGARIKANTIGTDLLKAGAVTSKILSADAIDGKTITGATVRTSMSFPRVEMNSGGLTALNRDGAPTFSVSSLTGDAKLVGVVESGLPGKRRVVIDDALWVNKPYLRKSGDLGYSDAAGIRLGYDTDPTMHGDISFAEIVTTDEVESEDGEEVVEVEKVTPSLTIEGPGLSANEKASIDMYQTGSLILKHAGTLTLRPTVATGERLTMHRSGSMTLKSRGDAELYLRHSGYARLRSGEGARIDLLNGITLQSKGKNSVYMRTGTGNAYITVGYESNEKNLYSAVEHRFLGGDIYYFNAKTVSYNANLYLGASGRISKGAASSRRYKLDIQDYDVPEELLDVPFRTWVDKAEAEENGGAEGLPRLPGLIAEEVAEVDSTFVIYDQEGRPDALHGDRIGMAALTLLRRQRDRIDDLEARLEALEERG